MESLESLFQLDVLPPRCGLEAQIQDNVIRFRAIREDDVASEWSGWFPLEECPIVLTWRTFWPEPAWQDDMSCE